MSSNRFAPPPPGFSAWMASASRQVSGAASVSTPGPSTPIISPPVSAIEGDPKSKGRSKKVKKWQTLDLAAVAPNCSGGPQQTDSHHGRDMGNGLHYSHTANGRQCLNENIGHARQGGGRSDRGQDPTLPIDMNGLSRGVNSMTIGGLRTMSTLAPSGPLTKFSIFGTLPVEMRLKIWRLAINIDRILEVIWDGAEKDPKTASHYHYRLSPRACARPALMNVCRESRAEAERFYTLVDFTTTNQNAAPDFQKCGPMKTYFNPKCDIILFGEHSCMWSVVRLLQDLRRANVDVHRVAIVASGQLLKCYDWNHDDPIQGPDQMEVDYGYAIAGGCTAMQALHGIHEDVAWTSMASGVKGLKEVLWVIPTHLMPGIAGKVDESIGFRTTRSSGLTTGQVKVKNNLQREVDLIEAGGVLPDCSVDGSMNNWAGDEKPEFKFVTVTPKSQIPGMVFDSMIVVKDDLPKLNGNDWQFIKNVERWTGCHVKIPKRDYPTQPSREIGLYGTKSGIEEAKKHIQDRLARLSGSNWTTPRSPKIAPGYMRSLGLKPYAPGAAASLY